MTVRIPLLLLVALLTGTALAAPRIEVIPLRSRTAAELLPVIKPLAGPGSTVTALGDRLVIKAEPDQLAAIRDLLRELDRPPRRLLIEVRRGWHAETASSGARLDARIGTEHTGVTLGRPRHDGVDVRLHAASTRRSDDLSQRVQALEGHPAYIAAGAAVPVKDTSVAVFGHTPVVQERTYYREATSGFYVVPQVNGDIVTLAIQQHADHAAAGGRFAVQRTGTTLSGRLGEWIDLGGSAGATHGRHGGIGRYASTRQDSDLDLQVRVTEIE